MKKYLFILAFLAFPALAHAQTGSLPVSTPDMTPAIDRTNNYIPVYAKNPGAFEPSEVMSWDDAIDLANRMKRNEASLGTIAREAREQKARENKLRVVANDDVRDQDTSNGRVSGPSKQ